MILEICLIMLCVFLCGIAGITDILHGKVFNKVLSFFLLISGVLVVSYYIQNSELFVQYIINLAIVIFIGYVFFVQKIWGAGDSKLWIVITIIFPYARYSKLEYELFPSMRIFVYIFLIAYVYVLLETLVKFILNPNKLKIKKKDGDILKDKNIIEILLNSFIVYIFYNICAHIFSLYYMYNRIFFMIIGLILASYIATISLKKKKIISFVCLCLHISILYSYSNTTIINIRQLLFSIIIVFSSILIRSVAGVFNYKEVCTSSVKKGMILSYGMILMFNKSRVKGLPTYTDETTKSRISDEEAEAIRRWEKSKYGESKVIIVEHLPFAIFFLLGLIFYIIREVVW
ncbi:MAG: hypothetical protein Q4F05_06355 [bacterium]|nr:hypothetical protein [bacterium]